MFVQDATNLSQEDVDGLVEFLAGFKHNLVGFSKVCFPWGEKGTELAAFDGPLAWQLELFQQVDDGLTDISTAIRLARTSGHGIGKSAAVAIIIWWAISTLAGTKGVVTANTENQLRTKTIPEVSKWHRLFVGGPLFRMTGTAIFSIDPELAKEWRVDFIPWSESNPAAFQGLHNQGKRLLIIFDEASGIADVIWSAITGALTDRNTEIIWLAFGNPNNADGYFYNLFDGRKYSHRWKTGHISSLDVEITNHEELQKIIDDEGPDSYDARVRVLGQFPLSSANSFISYAVAEEAAIRPLAGMPRSPIILGVDIGRFGEDPTVIYPRSGYDARSYEVTVLKQCDLMESAAQVMRIARQLDARAIFVDETGVGGGVVDRLNMFNLPVIGIEFNAVPQNQNLTHNVKCRNIRAEMWLLLREWLKRGGAIPESVDSYNLLDELSSVQYDYDEKSSKLQLEGKRAMRLRGVSSPNIADALALTFALPVEYFLNRDREYNDKAETTQDYNPYTKENIYV